MNAREEGFLLLGSDLGIPGRRILTTPQMRMLAKRVRDARWENKDREMIPEDLIALGYGREMAERILVLLEDKPLLDYYCQQGRKQGCFPLSRVSDGYPRRVKQALGDDTPGCLWYKGDLSLLRLPAVSLVGSRDLQPENRAFAREIGRQAARQGYVLVSGNARGADQEAQNACLASGGKVISVVADALAGHSEQENTLYLSEDSFDAPFSAQRALSRNRVIHSLGTMTFVAQCGYQTGGTWDGTVKNLRFGFSPVYCFADGSPAQQLLGEMGAERVDMTQLEHFASLPKPAAGFLDMEESL